MSTQTLSLATRPRGKPIRRLPSETRINADDTTEALHKALSAQTRLSIHRLRISKGSDGSLIPNSRNTTISSTGVRNQSIIYVKDVGPQIGWRTVFAVEYLGPLIIHPAVFFNRPHLYRDMVPPTLNQTLSLVFICVHFLKREYETFYIHRFSAATMPVWNIFKNSFYYWVIAGWNIANWTYCPHRDTLNPTLSYLITTFAVLLFLVAETGNFLVHRRLRDLRRPGSTDRAIPRGGGPFLLFDQVTCPNYFYETLAWIAIWILTGSLSTAIFLAIAVLQMYSWAKKKEARYRREFGDQYRPKRYLFIPGLI